MGNEVSVLMSEVSRARGAGRVLMPLSISTAATFFSASPDIRGEGAQIVRLFFAKFLPFCDTSSCFCCCNWPWFLALLVPLLVPLLVR